MVAAVLLHASEVGCPLAQPLGVGVEGGDVFGFQEDAFRRVPRRGLPLKVVLQRVGLGRGPTRRSRLAKLLRKRRAVHPLWWYTRKTTRQLRRKNRLRWQGRSSRVGRHWLYKVVPCRG